MRIGLQLPSYSYPGGDARIRSRLAAISQTAEETGIDSLWVMDHLLQLPADSTTTTDHDRWQRRATHPPPGGALRRCLQLPGPRPPRVRDKLQILRRHCEEVGRDYASIERTALDEIDLRPGRMTSADVVARARAQAEAGIQHWIVNMPDVWDLRYIEQLGRGVVPVAAQLPGGGLALRRPAPRAAR